MTRRIPWLAMGVVGVGAALLGGAWMARTMHLELPACPLKAHFGIPCATCGVTRCVLAVSMGRWEEAFHWHPVGASLIALSPVLILWDGYRAWRGRAYPSLPDSLGARLSVAALLIGTWILQIAKGV